MNITPWPMVQSSPIVTSSQMKAVRLRSVRAPIHAFLDLGERPDKTVVADSAAVDVARFDQFYPGAKFDVADADLVQVRLVHDATPEDGPALA